jgi:hypothetical protein
MKEHNGRRTMNVKQSYLGWATCILLLLGQIAFFYFIVTPQLQGGYRPLQGGYRPDVHSVAIFSADDDADVNSVLSDFTKRKEGGRNYYEERIDQIDIIPSSDPKSSHFKVVVIYHTVWFCDLNDTQEYLQYQFCPNL